MQIVKSKQSVNFAGIELKQSLLLGIASDSARKKNGMFRSSRRALNEKPINNWLVSA
jgi:hypothetical protein